MNLQQIMVNLMHATRCIVSKCDCKTVIVIIGRSNISTTLNLYVHSILKQKKL